MAEDYLGTIATTIQRFDRAHSASSTVTISIDRAGVVTPLTISRANNYTIAWGRPPPDLFLPPPAGQKRLSDMWRKNREKKPASSKC